MTESPRWNVSVAPAIMKVKIYIRSISIPPAVSAPQSAQRELSVVCDGGERAGSLVARNGLALEGNARVARRAQQLAEVRGAEYFDELAFVRGDPVGGRQSSDGADATLTWNFLFHDKQEHACEEALEEIEQVADRPHCVPQEMEDVAVEDHLPLDAPLRSEECSRVRGQAEAKLGTQWESWKRCLDIEKNSVVQRCNIRPFVVGQELVSEPQHPVTGASIVCTQRFGRGEWNAGSSCPLVEGGDVAAEG